MVSFSCESCCDVLVKKKLDQHANRCRGAQFTCLDCSMTFEGTSYRQHTSCITEAEKYQKGLYRPEKGKGRSGQNGNGQNGNGRGNQRNGNGYANVNGNANGGAYGANANLTPLGQREEKVAEGKKVEEQKVIEETVIHEREEKEESKSEKKDKKRKRKNDEEEKEEKDGGKKSKEKKEKKEKKTKGEKKTKEEKKEEDGKTDTKSKPQEKETTNGASLEETLAQKFLETISSEKGTSISKVIKKLDRKGAEEEVWELLKQAKVRKEGGGKVVLVLP